MLWPDLLRELKRFQGFQPARHAFGGVFRIPAKGRCIVGTDCDANLFSTMSLAKRATAEALGTAFLLATVVGSGIMAQNLAAGNTALALLANTLATGAALVALILTFGSISGAHFNPVVTLADAHPTKCPQLPSGP